MKLTDYLGDKPFWKVTVRLAAVSYTHLSLKLFPLLKKGEYVHIHNMKALRGRGDL